MKKKLSVVVPAYNEEAAVEHVLSRLVDLAFIDEIVFVDDGSRDETLVRARRLREKTARAKRKITIVPLPENRGKGHALRKGIRKTTGEVVAVCDADLEYDPAELESMLALITSGKADAVYGTRFAGARPHKVQGFMHYVGNKALTWITNILYNVHLTDMETCFKMVRGEILRSLDLVSESFDIEAEITAKLCRRRVKIYEVPVSYHGRGYDEGKKIHWYHGFQAVWALVKFRF